jgi:hypothetical protein
MARVTLSATNSRKSLTQVLFTEFSLSLFAAVVDSRFLLVLLGTPVQQAAAMHG